ncbi:hypothetical protein JCM1840_006088 [Sporobolomyces johnsonii]
MARSAAAKSSKGKSAPRKPAGGAKPRGGAKGGKKTADDEDDHAYGGDDDEELLDDDDVDEGNDSDPKKAGKEQLDLSLPPLHKIDDIFAHMVSRYKGELSEVVKILHRPLRIATMCSGTESPILALRLMFRALEQQTGAKAKVQHIFSAEIEPFKQAYIERNFSPPLLFRDVTELANDQARTAYGAMADVPGDVDMLIAGTSCVDYSSLNTKQKGINDNGESGRTFNGMLNWVQKHQPGIVILENVLKAPWNDVVKRFEKIDYDARHVGLDTKKYYIPHTRTRGYLIAVPRKRTEFFAKKSTKPQSSADMVDTWVERVKSAARSASSPSEAFLLHSDDPRIHRARQELSATKQKTKADGKQRAAVDWYKCEQRHSVARQMEKLGQRRPLTDWQDGGGKPKMPDGAWQDWAETQTERVLDLMDISYLRQAKLGTDITYKAAIWNLSQNVDRTTASKFYGITTCLTPAMIPYLTSRGGPVVGIEALALQGLPIEELLLTREDTDQLADLAGNAMSSTVVGTAIMQALCIAGHTLRAAREDDDADVKMDEAPTTDAELEARFRGADRLVEHPVDLASFEALPADLLDLAHRSARKCVCEGRNGLSTHPISTCESCGHSSCSRHQGKPEHLYVPDEQERLSPGAFEAQLKTMLPMRLTVSGFDPKVLRKKVDDLAVEGVDVDATMARRVVDAASEALEGAEFHFSRIDRQQAWTAVFKADRARLELHLEKNLLEWRLYTDAPAKLATNAPLRTLLSHPIARLRLSAEADSLLNGKWDLSVPLVETESTTIEMEYEEYVPSWRARLGLVEFLSEKRPKKISVKFNGDANILDRSIDGDYILEDRCGTAANSLYRRTEPKETTPLFLFLDPSSYLEAQHDAFVFADNCARTTSSRSVIASITPSWRLPTTPQDGEKKSVKAPTVIVPRTWIVLDDASLVAGSAELSEQNSFSTISKGFNLSVNKDDCKFAENLLSAVVKLNKAPSNIWAKETWHEVDLHLEGPEVFAKIGWMLSRIPDWQILAEWSEVDSGSLPDSVCQCCAPAPPTVKWIREIRQTARSIMTPVVPLEDGMEAARYESALKHRPSPVLIHTRQVEDRFELRVGLNAASLAHKALAQLPADSLSRWEMAAPKVSWRLFSAGANGTALGRQDLVATFSIKSNRDDPSAEQPKLFKKYMLRPEQLRSLHWMIEQEANPKPWIEEEVAESMLPELNWHAEAKATREVIVRGGVVADAVGYGKTAITIGLIAARLEEDAKLPEDSDRIPIKATLIVVPKHLIVQWPKEVEKFTDGGLVVVQVNDFTALKKLTIKKIMDADIVLISESIFQSDVFWTSLADFSASPFDIKMDKNAGRYFRHSVNETLSALPNQIERLREDGAAAVLEKIKKARETRDEHVNEVFIPLTRAQANKKAESAAKTTGGAKTKKAGDMTEAEVRQKLKEKDRVAAKKRFEGVDIWDLGKLGSRENDWKKMKAPPLAMFAWARIVVDEFTYTDGSCLVGVHSIRARARWILSGTPPLRDFSEIKTIANLLHAHLGIHDANEGSDKTVDIRNAEQTQAEKFRSYCDVRSRSWHARRDEVAQRFLDQFARQNVAEIDEIKIEHEIIKVALPGAEMAIYRELEHHLFNIDPQLAKIAKIKPDKQGDRDRRLREALGQSASPEEALLKRCSHFSLDLDEDETEDAKAQGVCDYIFRKRQEQLANCQEQFRRQLAACANMHRDIDRKGWYDLQQSPARHFVDWLRGLFVEGYGDREGDQCLRTFASEAGCANGTISRVKPADAPNPLAKDLTSFREAKSDKETSDEYAVGRMLCLREAVLVLTRLAKELVGRYRSARYFECVRTVLRSTDDDAENDLAVLSCCGHSGKVDDIKEAARGGHCIEPSCKANVSSLNVLTAESLGTDADSGDFGKKLQTLVALIKYQVPEEDRVLVFVQFDDLFHKVHEALHVHGIPTKVLQGTAIQQSKTLHEFQNPEDEESKVLLLRATDSSSSGANLTVANWAFFVSPLLTDTKQLYKALQTQAVGRIHRYGQLKTAHIIHLLTQATIDVQIFEERTDLNLEETIAKQPPRAAIDISKLKRVAELTLSKKKGTKVGAKTAQKLDKAAKDAMDAEDEDDAGLDGGSDHEERPAAKNSKRKGGKQVEELVLSDDEELETVDDEELEAEFQSGSDTETGSESEGGGAPSSSKREIPKRELPKRSTALRKSIIIQSDEEEEDDDMMVEVQRSSSKTSKVPAKKRVIADESEDEDEQPASSASKKRTAPAGTGKGKASDGPKAKKRKSIVIVEIPPHRIPRSPAKKQTTLFAFMKQTPAAATVAEGSNSSTPGSVVDASKAPSPLIDKDADFEQAADAGTGTETPARQVAEGSNSSTTGSVVDASKEPSPLMDGDANVEQDVDAGTGAETPAMQTDATSLAEDRDVEELEGDEKEDAGTGDEAPAMQTDPTSLAEDRDLEEEGDEKENAGTAVEAVEQATQDEEMQDA